MKDHEIKKTVKLTQGSLTDSTEPSKENHQHTLDKIKKPLIFSLMAIAFAGCLYLIFKPSVSQTKTEEFGFNDIVPQATDIDLQADKQKAYEQELFEQKDQEKRNSLSSLADYWDDEHIVRSPENLHGPQENISGYYGQSKPSNNPSLYSYRNAQSTLGNFYQENHNETTELKKQLEELKKQLTDQHTAPIPTINEQLALMEKSYEMAAKYLPSGKPNTDLSPAQEATIQANKENSSTLGKPQKESFTAFTPARRNSVSWLNRTHQDSLTIAEIGQERNRGFYSQGASGQFVQPKNSIRAVIQDTQEVTGEADVRIRLLEVAKTPNHTMQIGTVLTAQAKLQQGRLQLEITSIELEGNIIPVSISIYDLDGQRGLQAPNSAHMDALSEIAANMSQSSATSIMMTSSAGQQIAGDLTRGAVQGVSGYFSKKIRTPKVTLKAGHQVFLVSKN